MRPDLNIIKKTAIAIKGIKSAQKAQKLPHTRMTNIPLLPKDLLNTKAENRKGITVNNTFNTWERITNSFKLSLKDIIVK